MSLCFLNVVVWSLRATVEPRTWLYTLQLVSEQLIINKTLLVNLLATKTSFLFFQCNQQNKCSVVFPSKRISEMNVLYQTMFSFTELRCIFFSIPLCFSGWSALIHYLQCIMTVLIPDVVSGGKNVIPVCQPDLLSYIQTDFSKCQYLVWHFHQLRNFQQRLSASVFRQKIMLSQIERFMTPENVVLCDGGQTVQNG